MRAVRRSVYVVSCATLLAGVGGFAGPASDALAAPTVAGCAEPSLGASPKRVNPARVGMDPRQVRSAVAHGTRTGAYAVQIYRHGCLVADHSPNGRIPRPLASATKGVASVAVGRAITMGYFSLDDRLGKFFPRADRAHARITVRQVLNQTSGLRFSWPSDVAGLLVDPVQQTLHAPVDYAPGTRFQYSQNALALLPKIIEITTGRDFQDFVQKELMAPIGIARQNWVWLRDRSGNTAVNGGMAMRPADLGRIGRLLIQEGRWGNRSLVSPDYIRAGATPTKANGGYGFLWWLNAGSTHRGVDVPTPRLNRHPVFTGSPRDTYAFSGALGQFVTVIPSRDLVIVRLGVPARFDAGNPTGMLTGSNNPDTKELFRRVSAAVTDMPRMPYRDPYAVHDPKRSLVGSGADLDKLIDPRNTFNLILGVGPYESSECNIAVCNGQPLPPAMFGFLADLGDQLRTALAAAQIAPR